MDLATAYAMQVASYDVRNPVCIAQLQYVNEDEEHLHAARYFLDEPEEPDLYKLVIWRRYPSYEAARSEPDLAAGWPWALYVLTADEFSRATVSYEPGSFGRPQLEIEPRGMRNGKVIPGDIPPEKLEKLRRALLDISGR